MKVMSLTVSKNQTDSNFTPVPESTYVGICIGVIDLGNQKVLWKGEEKQRSKVAFVFELIGTQVSDEDTRPRVISKQYTCSLHENALLRKDLVSWRGKGFTEDEEENFTLAEMLGKPAYIQVIHESSQDGSKTYANVNTIMPLPAGAPIPAPANPFMAFDIDEFLVNGANEEVDPFKSLYPWLQNKVKESQQYKDYYNGIYQRPPQVGQPQQPTAPAMPPVPPPPPAPQQPLAGVTAAEIANDDDVPF